MTFGCARYVKSRIRIGEEARASRFFDTVRVCPPEDLSDEFRARFSDYKGMARGYGYWAWKPWLILNELEISAEEDVIVYADAGCQINHEGRERFNEYLETVRNHPSGFLGFQLTHLERHWTKGDLFAHLSAHQLSESGQVMSTAMLLRKTEACVALVREWLAIFDHPHLITDKPSQVPNYPGFQEHRHDQSALSLLTKMRGAMILPDETWYTNWEKGQRFPILAKRIRG